LEENYHYPGVQYDQVPITYPLLVLVSRKSPSLLPRAINLSYPWPF